MNKLLLTSICLLSITSAYMNAVEKAVVVPESNVPAASLLTRLCSKVRGGLSVIGSGVSKTGVYVSESAAKAWEKVPASAKNSLSYVKNQCVDSSVKLWSAATRTTTRKVVSGTIAVGSVAVIAAWRILQEKAPVQDAIA